LSRRRLLSRMETGTLSSAPAVRRVLPANRRLERLAAAIAFAGPHHMHAFSFGEKSSRPPDPDLAFGHDVEDLVWGTPYRVPRHGGLHDIIVEHLLHAEPQPILTRPRSRQHSLPARGPRQPEVCKRQ